MIVAVLLVPFAGIGLLLGMARLETLILATPARTRPPLPAAAVPAARAEDVTLPGDRTTPAGAAGVVRLPEQEPAPAVAV